MDLTDSLTRYDETLKHKPVQLTKQRLFNSYIFYSRFEIFVSLFSQVRELLRCTFVA